MCWWIETGALTWSNFAGVYLVVLPSQLQGTFLVGGLKLGHGHDGTRVYRRLGGALPLRVMHLCILHVPAPHSLLLLHPKALLLLRRLTKPCKRAPFNYRLCTHMQPRFQL